MNRNLFYTACITWILVSINALGQSEVRVDTRASGAVTICGDPITFTITVNNISSETLQNVTLLPQMPPGMIYVEGSAQNMTPIVGASSLSFTVGTMTTGQEKILTFNTTSNCDLITYLNNLGTPSLANNQTRVDYQVNGVVKTALEPNGSESYSVLYPQLELFVPENEKNMVAEYINVIKTRHIQIKNSGLGALSRLDFYTKNDIELQLQKVASGTTQLSASGSSALGTKFVITDFSQVGDGDNLFEENETLTLTDEVKVLTEKTSIETIYTVQWGCLTQVCNASDRQAVFSVYIEAIGGKPSVKVEQAVLAKTDFCNDLPSDIRYTYKNDGFGNSPAFRDAAFDFQLSFYEDYYFYNNVQSDHHFYIQQADETLTDITNLVVESRSNYNVSPGNGSPAYVLYRNYYTLSLSNRFASDPDGAGIGLEDMDNDGYFDDLPVGNSMVIRTRLSTTITGDDASETHNIIYYSGGWFKRWSGASEGISNIVNYNWGLSFVTSTKEIRGSSDLTEQQTQQLRFIRRSNPDYGYQYDYVKSDDAYFQLELELPLGVIITGARRDNVQSLTVQQTGNKAIVEGNATLQNVYLVDITLDLSLSCPDFSGSPEQAVKMKLYYFLDPTCPDLKIKIAEAQKVVFVHCETCSKAETTGFTAERKTLGWVPPPNGEYKYSEIFGSNPTASQVNSATPGLRLDAAYERDQVEFSIRGKVSGSLAVNNLKARIDYTQPFSTAAFVYTGMVFRVNGTDYTIPASVQPEVSVTDQDYTYIFTIPLGSHGVPAQLAPGTAFELKARYKVSDLVGLTRGEYYIKSIRGVFYRQEDAAQPCLSFGDDFNILKTDLKTLNSSDGSYQLILNTRTVFAAYTFPGANSGAWNGIPDFPNEFRPLFYLNDFTVTLPKGFIFDTSQAITCQSRNIENPVFSADKRTLTIARSDLYLIVNSPSMFFQAYIQIDCNNPDNLYEPVLTQGFKADIRNYTLRDHYVTYAYLPTTSEHLVSGENNRAYTSINEQRANLVLTANEEQEGYSELVKWPIQLCNSYSYYRTDAAHTWVSVELKPEDASTLLSGAKDENGNALPVVFYGPRDQDHPQGRNMLVQLGTIKVANCKAITVEARYKNCQDGIVQELSLYSSWAGNSYPQLSGYQGSVINRKPSCEGYLNISKLFLKYKTSALQWTVAKTGPEQVDLCVPVPFDIDLVSTKYADMHSLKVWIDLPSNASIDQVNEAHYSYPFASTPMPIPAAAWLNQNGRRGINIETLIGGNLPGTRLSNNKIRLYLHINTSCGFDPGLPIRYTVSGLTNCGDVVEYADQRKIKLFGITLDDIQLTLTSQNPSLKCFEENDMLLTLKNNGIEPSTPNQLEITLPPGVEFREILQSDLPAPVITTVNQQVVLQWSLPDSYLASGEQKTLSFRSYLAQTLPGVASAMFKARTFKGGNATCSGSSDPCPTQGTTGLHELPVPVSGLSALDFTYKKYLCAYKFTSVEEVYGNCAVTSHTWDFGDGSTSVEKSPLHKYAAPGNYTVLYTVSFTCGACSGNQTKQKQVVVNANPVAFTEREIDVFTDEKKQVISAAVSTFSDSWSLQYMDNTDNANPYLSATQGVWRNECSFVYDTIRDQSTSPSIRKDGTFTMDHFNWGYSYLEAIPGWIKTSTVTEYSPFSYELENKDVLGIYSSALYDYGGHLPSANGVNMRNDEMAYSGFEYVENHVTGNWVVSNQSLPLYKLYDVEIGYSNMAIVKTNLKQLQSAEKADVKGIYVRLAPFLIRTKYIPDNEIICLQEHPSRPDWSLVVFRRAVYERHWKGRIRIKNVVDAPVNADFDNTIAHSGKSSLRTTVGNVKIFKQELLRLDSAKAYHVSAWVSVNDLHVITPVLADDLGVELTIKNSRGQVASVFTAQPTGPVVEGWQQVRGTFTCPVNNAVLDLRFKPGSRGTAWYDDLRLHPENGNMKSYVYDLTDYRLRAILDEENFASFFYYDEEGNLYLTKKETVQGVKTITENVQYTVER
jgi:uncharacterized repeat protein (TIGR01451 family)